MPWKDKKKHAAYMREYRKGQQLKLAFLRGFYKQITEDCKYLGIDVKKLEQQYGLQIGHAKQTQEAAVD